MCTIKNNEGAYWHGKLNDELGRGSVEKAKRYPSREEAQKAANALLPTDAGESTVCSV
jgi:hypothetical protein